MMRTRFFCRVAVYMLIASVVACSPALAGKRVALIYADSTSYTLRTISGISWSLANALPDCEVLECYQPELPQNCIDKIKSKKPDVLVTIGTNVTNFARQNFPDYPIVFAKVLNPIESGFIKSWDSPGSRVTGAALDIPATQQVAQFLSILPGLHRIGMIHTAQTRRLRDEAESACNAHGISLVSIEIESTRELPAALDSLCGIVDGFWTVADEMLASPQFVRYMVMETMRYGVPIMGFNRNFVQNGALLCLEADYKFIGRQAGEIVVQVIKGADPADIKPTVPDIVYLYLNLKSSNLLKIDLAPEWISVARETF